MSEEFKEKLRSISFVGAKTVDGKFNRDREKARAKDLADYEQLRREGQQPDATDRFAIDRSKMFSDHFGKPYRGDDLTGTAKSIGLIDQVQEYTPEQRKIIRERLRDGAGGQPSATGPSRP